MRNKIKDIDIKNHTYNFFNDVINIKYFDIKIDEKSDKNILIYYIGCVTITDWKYVNIYIVNPLYLIFKKVNVHFEEVNGNKYLALVPTNGSKTK